MYHELGLAVYKAHFQTPLPSSLPSYRLKKRGRELKLPAPNSNLHHSNSKGQLWLNHLIPLASRLIAAMLVVPIPPSWAEPQPALFFWLPEYQSSLRTCITGCFPSSTRSQSTSQPCLLQKSEHHAFKTPFQDLNTCAAEAPPLSSQLLAMLPLPPPVMAGSYSQRFLINWSWVGSGIGIWKYSIMHPRWRTTAMRHFTNNEKSFMQTRPHLIILVL